MSNNPFDLGKKYISADEDAPAPDEPEVKTEVELLKGYIEIEKQFWPYILNGSHVRYRTKDQELHKGGIVSKGYPHCLTMRIGFSPKSPGFKKWSVVLEDVETIYQQIDASTIMVFSKMEVLWDNMVKMNKKLDALSKPAKK